MEGFPSPSVSMETPLKSTLVEEVVSLLSQDHRLPAFWYRHMIWAIACSRGWRARSLRSWGDLFRTLIPGVLTQPRTSLLTPFIPGCSWGPLLVPSGFHHTLCTVQVVLFSRCLDMKKVARLLLCCFFWILSYPPPPSLSSSFHSVKYWEV